MSKASERRNRAYVNEAIEILCSTVEGAINSEMKQHFKFAFKQEVASLSKFDVEFYKDGSAHWDCGLLMSAIKKHWTQVFEPRYPRKLKNLAYVVTDIRNDVSHRGFDSSNEATLNNLYQIRQFISCFEKKGVSISGENQSYLKDAERALNAELAKTGEKDKVIRRKTIKKSPPVVEQLHKKSVPNTTTPTKPKPKKNGSQKPKTKTKAKTQKLIHEGVSLDIDQREFDDAVSMNTIQSYKLYLAYAKSNSGRYKNEALKRLAVLLASDEYNNDYNDALYYLNLANNTDEIQNIRSSFIKSWEQEKEREEAKKRAVLITCVKCKIKKSKDTVDKSHICFECRLLERKAKSSLITCLRCKTKRTRSKVDASHICTECRLLESDEKKRKKYQETFWTYFVVAPLILGTIFWFSKTSSEFRNKEKKSPVILSETKPEPKIIGGVKVKNYVNHRSILIKNIQTELARLGLYTGSVDGTWGPLSQNALLTFNANFESQSYKHPTNEVLNALKQVSVNDINSSIRVSSSLNFKFSFIRPRQTSSLNGEILIAFTLQNSKPILEWRYLTCDYSLEKSGVKVTIVKQHKALLNPSILNGAGTAQFYVPVPNKKFDRVSMSNCLLRTV